MKVLKTVRDLRIINSEEGVILTDLQVTELCDDIIDGLVTARREGYIAAGLGIVVIGGSLIVGKAILDLSRKKKLKEGD